MNIKAWISAMRLRTLPLSLSSTILATFIAAKEGYFDGIIFTLALTTTVLLQILSNLANDYGDGVKGTDNANRIGPQRAVQSGVISVRQMRNGVILFSFLAFISGVSLVFYSLLNETTTSIMVFILLGLASIAAAIMYTVGKKAYGYHGLGDFFVFVFFGFTGVLGTYFLYTKSIDWIMVLPAIAIGTLSVGVLNLNNMRDIHNDKGSGKNTLAVQIGLSNAKRYHTFLIFTAMFCGVFFTTFMGGKLLAYAFIILFVWWSKQLQTVWKIKDPKLLDPLLKKLAISTLLFAITLGLGIYFFSA